MNDELYGLIAQHRRTAEEAGEAARLAIENGDIGMARTAARQAAQWARVVMQLETGEKQIEPHDSQDQQADALEHQTRAADSGKVMF
ncbi:MAG: hypothetical protein LC731_04615 [Acidobacteria bacterium]|nr:hypothetical protein [Acidobacteriota bacterium]